MSDPESSGPRRPAALAMLADGNAPESVAHMLGVPVATVLAWRDGGLADESEPPAPAPARDAVPRVRFDDELSHALPARSRVTILAVGAVMVGVLLWLIVPVLREGHVVDAGMMLVVLAISIASLGRVARRSLVLGADEVVVPGLFGSQAIAYSDIAGYQVERRALALGFRIQVPGRMLTLRSRRPGAAPLVVFIADGNPVDPRIFLSLDDAVRANQGAAPLPPLAGQSLARQLAARRRPFVAATLILLLAAASFWPMVSGSVRTLWHDTPALAALRHVEGPVNGASPCRDRSRHDGVLRVATVGIGQGAGAEDVIVPCLFDPQALLHGGPHQLAVDLDARARPVPVVYQMRLDGRVLLSYAEARVQQRNDGRALALVGALLPLAGLVFMACVLWTAWRGASGRAVAGA